MLWTATLARSGRQGRAACDSQDGGVGRLGWRASDQHTASLVVIPQLQRRLQGNEDAMLDLALDELPDNGILGGKGFLNRPVILVHLVG